MKYTFSSDGEKYTEKDLMLSRKYARKYFETETDSEQIDPNKENVKLFRKLRKNNFNIIKQGQEFVGSIFIIPTSKETMNDFLKKHITEDELFKKSINLQEYKNPQAIYLCSAIILEKHRKKGLATKGFLKLIKATSKENLPLYFWGYSKEGKKLAKKVAKLTKRPLKERK